jgi:hypothetical protein
MNPHVRTRTHPFVSLAVTLVLLSVLVAADDAMAGSRSGIFSVRDHGAAGDGVTLDTGAINRAIMACAEAGGGQVLFPPGTYLSGTVHLKSGITLYFDAGSALVGTTNLAEYQHCTPPPPMPESKWTRWHRALIIGDGVERVSLSGSGVIDGNRVFDSQGEERMRGPHTILLVESRDISVRGVTIRDSANYAILMHLTDRVDIHDVTITGGWDAVHFRGWKGRPCRDVRISGCRFFTGDDAIAGRFWENVVITDTILNSSCNGIRLIGPAKGLIIQNCLFYGPGVHPHRTSNRHNMLAGVCLQPGGWDRTEGELDDVLISDLTMHKVSTPFFFVLKPGNTAGRVVVNRVAATSVYRAAASVESWADEPFGQVTFRDVSVDYEGGGAIDQVPLAIKGPGVDARPLPAWAFYARNVDDLRLEDIRFSYQEEDLRAALMADHVKQVTLDNVRFDRADESADLVRFSDVARVVSRAPDLQVDPPVCVGLDIVAEGDSERLLTGEPFSVNARVGNGPREGLAQVELRMGGERRSDWVWLRPDETREVRFEGLVVASPGALTIGVGELERTLKVESSGR